MSPVFHFLPCTHSLAPRQLLQRNGPEVLVKGRHRRSCWLVGNLCTPAYVLLIKNSEHLWRNVENTVLSVMPPVKVSFREAGLEEDS